jgi:hypothetical protein
MSWASSASVSPTSKPVLRPSQTSAISSSSEARECSPRVAAGGDVGVELVGAGDESLVIVQVAEGRSVPDEHWAGLQQVADWARRQLGAPADVDLPSST